MLPRFLARPRKIPALAALVLAAALASSCAWFSGEGPPPHLSMFNDLALPAGLEVDQKNSRVYEQPVGRVGLMKASGRVKGPAALAHFRQTLPRQGWRLESEFDNGDAQTLIFSKSPRAASVSIRQGWIYTDVEVNVSAGTLED